MDVTKRNRLPMKKVKVDLGWLCGREYWPRLETDFTTRTASVISVVCWRRSNDEREGKFMQKGSHRILESFLAGGLEGLLLGIKKENLLQMSRSRNARRQRMRQCRRFSFGGWPLRCLRCLQRLERASQLQRLMLELQWLPHPRYSEAATPTAASSVSSIPTRHNAPQSFHD